MIDINEFIGIPYKFGGDDFSGVDCWGLVRLVYRECFDMHLPNFTAESIDPADIHLAVQAGLRYQLADLTDSPRDFDVALVRRREFSYHAGLYYQSGFIHASSNAGSVVFDRPDSFEKTGRGTIETYRVRNIDL